MNDTNLRQKIESTNKDLSSTLLALQSTISLLKMYKEKHVHEKLHIKSKEKGD